MEPSPGATGEEVFAGGDRLATPAGHDDDVGATGLRARTQNRGIDMVDAARGQPRSQFRRSTRVAGGGVDEDLSASQRGVHLSDDGLAHVAC
jgi:hypothetical protein